LGRRHFKPEQIIHMLREAEIKLAGGKTTGEVCRELGILRAELLPLAQGIRRHAGIPG
jgi:hypothetical protein